MLKVRFLEGQILKFKNSTSRFLMDSHRRFRITIIYAQWASSAASPLHHFVLFSSGVKGFLICCCCLQSTGCHLLFGLFRHPYVCIYGIAKPGHIVHQHIDTCSPNMFISNQVVDQCHMDGSTQVGQQTKLHQVGGGHLHMGRKQPAKQFNAVPTHEPPQSDHKGRFLPVCLWR